MAVCVEVGGGEGVAIVGALPQSSPPHAARNSAAATATIETRHARMQGGDILMPERRVPHRVPRRQRGRQHLLDHALADPRSDREPVSRYAGEPVKDSYRRTCAPAHRLTGSPLASETSVLIC